MFTLPRKFFFALEAVLYIACHGGIRPVSSKEICKENGLSTRYLEPIMQCLVREKVVRGVRGPKGGYFLIKERRRITLGDIFRLMRAFEQEPDTKKSSKQIETYIGKNVICPLWAELENELLDTLDATTIEDLCQKMEADGDASSHKPSDFVI